jgi:hypothetical protein
VPASGVENAPVKKVSIAAEVRDYRVVLFRLRFLWQRGQIPDGDCSAGVTDHAVAAQCLRLLHIQRSFLGRRAQPMLLVVFRKMYDGVTSLLQVGRNLINGLTVPQ